ncbi:hypothetical protein ES703_109162 [subsurface metagenome]
MFSAYLLRGGLAYGRVEEMRRYTNGISYLFTIGNGLALAYETQCIGRGMRLFIHPKASRYFVPKAKEKEDGVPGIRIDRCHDASGRIVSREIRWVGLQEQAEMRLKRAVILFGNYP